LQAQPAALVSKYNHCFGGWYPMKTIIGIVLSLSLIVLGAKATPFWIVSLRGNPLSALAKSRDLPELQKRAFDVIADR
jgi:hypothetical protein